MSTISQRKDGAASIAGNADVCLEWEFGNRFHGQAIAPAVQKNLEIRRHHAEGITTLMGDIRFTRK